jgi:hypothetical protein|nr:hypothetical protein [Neorhizobium tomejilense]
MTSSVEKIAILLNGPKYCGKDTAASAILEAFGNASALFRFTVPVKEETHRRYGLDVAYDHYEDQNIKDAPLPEFGGLSPRQAYIKVGDELRAEHGPHIVTAMLCEKIRNSDVPIVVNPDCGGDGEAEGIVDELGHDRVIVFRIHKEGHDYAGDSRNWVTSDKVRKIDITNVDGQVSDYLSTVVQIAEMFRSSSQVPTESDFYGTEMYRRSFG